MFFIPHDNLFDYKTIMHYFYDTKTKKLNGETDENKRFVVGWAEGGCVTKFKVVSLHNLETFYHSLNCSFSKIIYQFPPSGNIPWVVYNGSDGESADNISIAIQNIDWF